MVEFQGSADTVILLTTKKLAIQGINDNNNNLINTK